MKNKMLVVEIPESLSIEINKFLADKAQGKSTQGMIKTTTAQALFEFLNNRKWKMNKNTNNDCMEVINKGRFKI